MLTPISAYNTNLAVEKHGIHLYLLNAHALVVRYERDRILLQSFPFWKLNICPLFERCFAFCLAS